MGRNMAWGLLTTAREVQPEWDKLTCKSVGKPTIMLNVRDLAYIMDLGFTNSHQNLGAIHTKNLRFLRSFDNCILLSRNRLSFTETVSFSPAINCSFILNRLLTDRYAVRYINNVINDVRVLNTFFWIYTFL